MKRPYGLTDNHMPPIVELNKALYGLPKASQYFEEFLSAELFLINNYLFFVVMVLFAISLLILMIFLQPVLKVLK